MVLAIAAGIADCVVSRTLFHARSGNPIWWKSDRLFAVTMDSYDPNSPADAKSPELPPSQLTYRDAMYLHASDIPERSVIMYRSAGVLVASDAQGQPLPASARITTGDFFKMFDVPLRYGHGWDRTADDGFEPVIVLSDKMNTKLFGGVNSVGRRVTWNDREFRVIGVLGRWRPQPLYYDLNNGPFDPPEDVYLPWGSGTSLRQPSAGTTNCWKSEKIVVYQDFLNSECVWIQMWVELPDAAAQARMQSLIDTYWAHERGAGRFPRPRNNRLTNVDQWLVDQRVVANDYRVLVGLAFAFLAVCLINTVGLLLAKFLNAASIAGIRRALGASRRALLAQHLGEVAIVAGGGAVLGLAFAALGLYAVRVLYTTSDPAGGGFQELAHFDMTSILWAAVLAVVTALLAGLYPAWRIGRVAPAVYLKNR
jgi:putative ABC transport system permease protein